MERTASPHPFIVECPYCGKNHDGTIDTARIINPRTGVTNVLARLPCKNIIVLFFSASHQLRGYQPIDEIDVVSFRENGIKDPPRANYNDDYKAFAAKRGMQRRLKDTIVNGEGADWQVTTISRRVT